VECDEIKKQIITIQEDGHGSLRASIPAKMKKQGWKKGDKLTAYIGKNVVKIIKETETAIKNNFQKS